MEMEKRHYIKKGKHWGLKSLVLFCMHFLTGKENER